METGYGEEIGAIFLFSIHDQTQNQAMAVDSQLAVLCTHTQRKISLPPTPTFKCIDKL